MVSFTFLTLLIGVNWLSSELVPLGPRSCTTYAGHVWVVDTWFFDGSTGGTAKRFAARRVALHGEEYVRPEMLKWMAVGKEEHREKEELKKLAMKARRWFSTR